QARCYNCRGLGHIARNCTARPRRMDVAYLQIQLLNAQKEEAGIQLQAEEFDFMAAAGDLDEIEEVNANCILEDKFLDKEVELKAIIKDLENILLKRDQTVQTMQETLELAQESREKMRLLKKEIKPVNYAKINHLSGFLNEVESSLVTLQRVVKQKMTLKVHNWSSFAHKEVHRIISYEIALIINQVDARVQNFKMQFLKEAAKFVRDFKSLAKEADESVDKQKYLELKIERLLKASVSHDIMSIVQNRFVDVPSDLRTELDRTKEKLKLCIIKKEKEYVVLWNNWYTKYEECKYDKISYDKAYNDMQQKVE
nr:hypothetical protein [Tanacetum cinerariifolium]